MRHGYTRILVGIAMQRYLRDYGWLSSAWSGQQQLTAEQPLQEQLVGPPFAAYITVRIMPVKQGVTPIRAAPHAFSLCGPPAPPSRSWRNIYNISIQYISLTRV
jgi:hypothetical protein